LFLTWALYSTSKKLPANTTLRFGSHRLCEKQRRREDLEELAGLLSWVLPCAPHAG
jgi:hypothetical protein